MADAGKMPLISVVLATYNGERYLDTQLSSVFEQTYPNLEVIAVDDLSTDTTPGILKKYSDQHSNMKVIFNDHTLGPIKNFQKGCELSNGAFIALCDQDDYWAADKLSKLYDAIGSYPMVYCDSFICDEALNKTGRNISDNVACQTLTNCLQQAVFGRIYGHATLFSRALFNQANPFLEVISHDWWLCYFATLAGGIKYLDEPLNFYRQHASNYYGAVGTKRKKVKETKQQKKAKKTAERNIAFTRINAFYKACPDELTKEKRVLLKLVNTYQSFSLANNFLRMALFFRYNTLLLAVKKRSKLRKYLFCFKTFVKMI